MAGYVIAQLRPPDPIPAEVERYMELVQDTLDPFGGSFLVHGGALEVREGQWPGDAVVIQFPSVERARGWYDSAAYAQIRPLRTDNIDCDVVIVEGA